MEASNEELFLPIFWKKELNKTLKAVLLIFMSKIISKE